MARAGTMHVQAWAYGQASGFATPPTSDYVGGSYEDSDRGSTSSAATGQFYDAVAESSARGSVSLARGGGMRLSADGRSSFAAGSPSSQAVAAAQWADTLRVVGEPIPPETLRVVFHISGSWSFRTSTELGQVFAEARMNVGLDLVSGRDLSEVPPGIIATATSSSLGGKAHTFFDYSQDPAELVSYLDPISTSSNVHNLSIQSSGEGSLSFEWDAYFDVYHSSELGGYSMNAIGSAASSTWKGASSNVDFGSTIRLTAVTRTDGSALPGPVTFDSGFQLAAVPEPSSVIMLATGAIGLLGYGWRRRRAAVA